jgi:hypothetical protein
MPPVRQVINDHNVSDSYFHCFQSFLWACSIYFEAIAIVPQMTLLRRKKVVENLTANYIVALGFYRVMYLVNWAYRHPSAPPMRTLLAAVSPHFLTFHVAACVVC